jgi:hypothetical protein
MIHFSLSKHTTLGGSLKEVNQALWARRDKPCSVETVALEEELMFRPERLFHVYLRPPGSSQGLDRPRDGIDPN